VIIAARSATRLISSQRSRNPYLPR